MSLLEHYLDIRLLWNISATGDHVSGWHATKAYHRTQQVCFRLFDYEHELFRIHHAVSLPWNLCVTDAVQGSAAQGSAVRVQGRAAGQCGYRAVRCGAGRAM